MYDFLIWLFCSSGVGKTSVVIRYVGGMFSKAVSPTIGASFFTYKLWVAVLQELIIIYSVYLVWAENKDIFMCYVKQRHF